MGTQNNFRMKYFFLAVFASLCCIQFSSAQLNSYAYVVVPKKLQDFEEENQYHSSTLLKYLLTQNNFTAYYEGDIPGDADAECLGLEINLLDESTMLRTKVFLIMTDCKGSEVYRTMEGSSRIKDLKDAYEEAIRNAFRSIAALNYHYKPAKMPETAAVVSAREEEKNMVTAETQKAGTPMGSDTPVVDVKATPEEQLYVDKRPVPSTYTAGVAASLPAGQVSEDTEMWYAQVLPDGYQLVDKTPRIRLILKNTSLPEVYLAENEDSNGLVYKDGGQWHYEFYRDGRRVVEELHIRF